MSIVFFVLGAVFGKLIKTGICRIKICGKTPFKICPSDFIKYPFFELLNGVLFLQTYLEFGLNANFLAIIVLLCCLISCAIFDLKYFIIPDIVVFPTMTFGLIVNALLRRQAFLYYIMGFFFAGGIILFIAVISRGGMGGGDVKLFATVGMFLGLKLTVLSVILSFVFAGTAGLLLILLKLKKLKDPIPFGPFIALGSAASLFFGDEIIRWYLKSFFL